jgi:hypothetical protein
MFRVYQALFISFQVDTSSSGLETGTGKVEQPDFSPQVLLCWGEKSGCSTLPVPVSSPEDEVSTWKEINRAS